MTLLSLVNGPEEPFDPKQRGLGLPSRERGRKASPETVSCAPWLRPVGGIYRQLVETAVYWRDDNLHLAIPLLLAVQQLMLSLPFPLHLPLLQTQKGTF